MKQWCGNVVKIGLLLAGSASAEEWRRHHKDGSWGKLRAVKSHSNKQMKLKKKVMLNNSDKSSTDSILVEPVKTSSHEVMLHNHVASTTKKKHSGKRHKNKNLLLKHKKKHKKEDPKPEEGEKKEEEGPKEEEKEAPKEEQKEAPKEEEKGEKKEEEGEKKEEEVVAEEPKEEEPAPAAPDTQEGGEDWAWEDYENDDDEQASKKESQQEQDALEQEHDKKAGTVDDPAQQGHKIPSTVVGRPEVTRDPHEVYPNLETPDPDYVTDDQADGHKSFKPESPLERNGKRLQAKLDAERADVKVQEQEIDLQEARITGQLKRIDEDVEHVVESKAKLQAAHAASKVVGDELHELIGEKAEATGRLEVAKAKKASAERQIVREERKLTEVNADIEEESPKKADRMSAEIDAKEKEHQGNVMTQRADEQHLGELQEHMAAMKDQLEEEKRDVALEEARKGAHSQYHLSLMTTVAVVAMGMVSAF